MQMLIAEHEEITSASAASLWSQYVDVASWSQWDRAIQVATLDGPFAAGTRGVLKPKNGPATPFRLEVVEPLRSFTDVSQLPLAKLTFMHSLDTVAGGTRFKHRITLDGPLAFLYARIMGPAMRSGLPEAMRLLAKTAADSALDI